MIGLILKDFINLKKSIKVFGAVLLFYIFMAYSINSPSYIGSMFTLIFAMLTLSTYSYDDLAKWDSFALTMPIKREHIVQGKYLIMLLLSAVSFLVSNGVLLILNLVMKKQDIFEGMQITAIGTVIVILFYCIVIPFVTKLGVEKARLIILVIYAVPFLLGSIGFKALKARYPEPPTKLVHFGKLLLNNIYIIVPLAVVSVLLISYNISLNIYKKKEF